MTHKITRISQQLKDQRRYSIYVDGKYAFSLGEDALLTSKVSSGQELTQKQLDEYKKLSGEDKLYSRTLKYIALRPRTKWEIESYLARKKATPPQTELIINKLSNIDLIDDKKLAFAYVNDRNLLRPTSRRKLIAELRKKHIDSEIIEAAVNSESHDEKAALEHIVARKRQQTKYQDDLKLMRYLAGQGFNYGDIKEALNSQNDMVE